MNISHKYETDKPLDVMILRFPQIAEKVFGELDDKTMTNCKEVSRPWNVFLDEEKVQWFRILQKYVVCFYNDWQIVLKKTPATTIKSFALWTQQYFKINPEFVEQNIKV